jgi:large subunit ribosomal protein L10
MAITRKEKEQIVARLADTLKGSKGVVFANYRGLTVKEMEELRRRAREQSTRVQVAKLTLMQRAFQSAGIDVQLDINTPTVLAYSSDDEVTPAKILAKFAEETKKLELSAGILDGQMVSGAQVKALAQLPGKQELRGQLVSVVAGPMRGVVQVCAGLQRSLLYTLNAVAEKKGAA